MSSYVPPTWAWKRTLGLVLPFGCSLTRGSALCRSGSRRACPPGSGVSVSVSVNCTLLELLPPPLLLLLMLLCWMPAVKLCERFLGVTGLRVGLISCPTVCDMRDSQPWQGRWGRHEEQR